MSLFKVIILAVIQGLAELLPVSSSAHVVVAEKLMGFNPSAPSMTLLLVMLHTGTMFAVIVYFWRQWRDTIFSSVPEFKRFAWQAVIATFFTGVIGEGIAKIIEHTALRNVPHAQIEDIFGRLGWVAPALAVGGVLIIIAGFSREARNPGEHGDPPMDNRQASIIGAVQGLCLPFRGFSRSGATISAGMLSGVGKARSEAFSFALAVILTPPVVVRELLRLHHADHAGFAAATIPSLFGMIFSFLAGLLALKWLSAWLEKGRWYYFGIYCLVASAVVFYLHIHLGY